MRRPDFDFLLDHTLDHITVSMGSFTFNLFTNGSLADGDKTTQNVDYSYRETE